MKLSLAIVATTALAITQNVVHAETVQEEVEELIQEEKDIVAELQTLDLSAFTAKIERQDDPTEEEENATTTTAEETTADNVVVNFDDPDEDVVDADSEIMEGMALTQAVAANTPEDDGSEEGEESTQTPATAHHDTKQEQKARAKSAKDHKEHPTQAAQASADHSSDPAPSTAKTHHAKVEKERPSMSLPTSKHPAPKHPPAHAKAAKASKSHKSSKVTTAPHLSMSNSMSLQPIHAKGEKEHPTPKHPTKEHPPPPPKAHHAKAAKSKSTKMSKRQEHHSLSMSMNKQDAKAHKEGGAERMSMDNDTPQSKSPGGAKAEKKKSAGSASHDVKNVLIAEEDEDAADAAELATASSAAVPEAVSATIQDDPDATGFPTSTPVEKSAPAPAAQGTPDDSAAAAATQQQQQPKTAEQVVRTPDQSPSASGTDTSSLSGSKFTQEVAEVMLGGDGAKGLSNQNSGGGNNSGTGGHHNAKKDGVHAVDIHDKSRSNGMNAAMADVENGAVTVGVVGGRVGVCVAVVASIAASYAATMMA